jgi:phage gp16-like protein
LGLRKRASRLEEAPTLPYTVRRRDGAYQVVDRETGKVYSRHATKENAERQRRLLEGIRHGWKPTGKKG